MNKKINKYFDKHINVFLVSVILIGVLGGMYLNRGVLFKQYNTDYWKDRFEHSQWVLPASTRIIGDDGLFAYAGYRMFQGEDPTFANVETQPVAKYLIGLSIGLFGTYSYYSLGMYFGVVTVTLLLAYKLLRSNKKIAILVAGLVALDPMMVSQYKSSWLDSTQVFFLLLFYYLYLVSNKRFFILILSGISLGLFAETKLAVLLPIVGLLLLVDIILKRRFITVIPLGLGFSIGFLLPYARYFQLGHTPADFVNLQRYILSFYRSSALQSDIYNLGRTLLLGQFKGYGAELTVTVSQWWIFWPIVLCTSIIFAVFVLKKQVQKELVGIWLYIVLCLVLFMVIPMYPRYLVVVLPFMYIIFGFFLMYYKKMQNSFVLMGILLIALIFSIFSQIQRPDDVLANYFHTMSYGYYQDVYEEAISNPDDIPFGKEEFWKHARKIMNNASVMSIEIEETERNIPLYGDSGYVLVEVTYHTRNLGSFMQTKVVNLRKQNGQWKVVWDWDHLLDNYTPESIVTINVEVAQRGSIIDSKGKKVAYDDMGYLYRITPDMIAQDREEEMLTLMEDTTGREKVHLQNAYLENVPRDKSVDVATVFIKLTEKQIEMIQKLPGIELVEAPVRYYEYIDQSISIENKRFDERSTRLYSSTNYSGDSWFEEDYDVLLSAQNGGSIIMSSPDGESIVVHSQEKVAAEGDKQL